MEDVDKKMRKLQKLCNRVTISTPEGAQRFQLIAWKAAIKLEKLGTKRHGSPARKIAATALGMKSSSSHDEVITAILKRLEETA